MKKRGIIYCMTMVVFTAFLISGCAKSAADEATSGITEEAAAREYDSIDFDTVTIMDEEVPLGSSVNNADTEEMTALRTMAVTAFELANQQRTAAGLAALTWDADLENAAAVRAAECVQLFSHTRPDGSEWYTVNSQIMHGENLAFGYDSANSVVTAWMNSPSHKDNILYPSFTRGAIAIYKSGNTYYFAQEFRY